MLCAIGYGRTTLEHWLERVKKFPEGTLFIDVREEDSGSRNGREFFWGYPHQGKNKGEQCMCTTVGKLRMDYIAFPALGNIFPNTVGGLEKYRKRLFEDPEAKEQFETLVEFIYDGGYPCYCLLCTERFAFYPNGRMNCHRVVIGQELEKRLDVTVTYND